MSEVFEPWSHPWHALQRTLAKAFGADALAHPEPANAASWLVRARSAAAAPASAPR